MKGFRQCTSPGLWGLAILALAPWNMFAGAGRVCTDANLAGNYGFKISGINTFLNIAFLSVGHFRADGKGSIAGGTTQAVAGNIGRLRFTGSYSVQEDCTGTATFRMGNSIFAHIDFVILNDGNDLDLIVADPGTVEGGTAKKQMSLF
jgi:hypothetical protein